jgi:hypothetical protein
VCEDEFPVSGNCCPNTVQHFRLHRPQSTIPRGNNWTDPHVEIEEKNPMAKPHRLIKKANHGARPANAKARRAKRRKVRT